MRYNLFHLFTIAIQLLLCNSIYSQEIIASKTFKNTIYGVDIAPDGSKVFTAGKDSVATIWNLNTNSSIQLIGHQHSISSINYNAKYNTVVTGSYDNMAILWDKTGEEIAKLIGHSSGVINVTQSDELIGTASRDNTARVWDRKGNHMFTLGHKGQVNAIEFVPERKWIVTVSFDELIRIWDNKGMLINTYHPHTSGIKSVAIDVEKEIIVTGHKDGQISIVDFNGNKIRTIEAHNTTVSEIIIEKDHFISSGMDGTIKTWSWEGILINKLEAHDSYVSDIAITNEVMVSSSGDKSVKVWKIGGTNDDIPVQVLRFFGDKNQSIKSNENSPIETEQFGQFAGIWYCSGFQPDPLGKEDEVPYVAFWAWKYILDGYGVQDFFYQGQNEFRYWDYFKRDKSLTQLRVYDTMDGLWKIAFITNSGGTIPGRMFGIYTAKMHGKEIIMEPVSQNTDNMSRVVFYDITNDSFEWKAETSIDSGKSWNTTITLSAKRLE